MTQDKQIYNFGDYITTSEEIAELFFYSKKIEASCTFSQNASVENLVQNQTTVSGCVSCMKASLEHFMQKEYETSLDELTETSYGGRIVALLNKIKSIVFYFQEVALGLPIEKLKDNLQQAMERNQRLPQMIAALDAGEDEIK